MYFLRSRIASIELDWVTQLLKILKADQYPWLGYTTLFWERNGRYRFISSFILNHTVILNNLYCVIKHLQEVKGEGNENIKTENTTPI